jgi:hypothetical protein
MVTTRQTVRWPTWRRCSKSSASLTVGTLHGQLPAYGCVRIPTGRWSVWTGLWRLVKPHTPQPTDVLMPGERAVAVKVHHTLGNHCLSAKAQVMQLFEGAVAYYRCVRVEDQRAEEAAWGIPREDQCVRVGSRLTCDRAALLLSPSLQGVQP